MKYAQILNSVVVNVIRLDESSNLSEFSEGFDALVEVSSDPGSPGIGWSYDPETGFTAPVVAE